MRTEIGDLFTDGEAFYAMTFQCSSSGRLLRSTDGVDWEEVADVGTEVSTGAYGGGTYVLVSKSTEQPRFFFSDDGETFTEGELHTELGGVGVREVGFGWMASCPLATP